jgi:ABC-type lipoprotein release transport system permease subunit
MVLGDGVRVALAGFAIGGLASWAIGRALRAFEYGVTANDPLTWVLVTTLVASTVLAAAWLPARRAMRVDPGHLLRE